jgi:glycosyltransferase involved in cell wall biosynthesis
MKNIKLSVAIVTRNRPDILTQCIESWRAQTVQPFEIIISDDSSEIYASQINAIANKYNCIYVKGPGTGLYANRNKAALACTGTHIVTGDDDHTHPLDYIEQIINLIKEDQNRIWIFGERNTLLPEIEPSCPGELQNDGVVRAPSNPADCAAIADGATVYPRAIFDSGLRYDQTYRFGGLWYLWGRILVKNGWKISYSDKTFIWHHGETDFRKDDKVWLLDQIECNLYVSTYFAFKLHPSLKSISRAIYNLFKKSIVKSSIFNYNVKVRLPFFRIKRIINNVMSNK